MKYTRKISVAIITVSVLCSLSLVRTSGVGQPVSLPIVLTSVAVLSDRLDPIQGAVVKLDSTVTVTNAEGQTPWRAMDPSAGVALVLAEKTLAGGIAVGMMESGILPSELPDPAEDFFLMAISRTQPLAVPVQVQGLPDQMNNVFPPAGDYPHWRVAVPTASSLRFTLHIASLLDAEAIEHYAAYRGATLDPQLGYVRGVTLVMPGVQIGNGGVVIGIALLGALQDGVVVDAYNFATGNLAPAGPRLDVRIAGIHNDVVYVLVTGGVRKGHLALLARPSGGQERQIEVLPDSPPELILTPDSGQGVESACLDCGSGGPTATSTLFDTEFSSALVVTDCEPVVPTTVPGWTCDPIPPSPGHCGPGSPGTKQCKIVRSRTPLVCRSPGATVEGTKVDTAKWKVTFHLTGGTGTPLSSEGGFEYGQESTTVLTEAWTAGDGAHDLGQCMRYFRFDLVCLQEFTNYADVCLALSDGTTTWADCVVPFTTYETCTDDYSSQNVCSRTP
jgi:hypothetical protein